MNWNWIIQHSPFIHQDIRILAVNVLSKTNIYARLMNTDPSRVKERDDKYQLTGGLRLALPFSTPSCRRWRLTKGNSVWREMFHKPPLYLHLALRMLTRTPKFFETYNTASKRKRDTGIQLDAIDNTIENLEKTLADAKKLRQEDSNRYERARRTELLQATAVKAGMATVGDLLKASRGLTIEEFVDQQLVDMSIEILVLQDNLWKALTGKSCTVVPMEIEGRGSLSPLDINIDDVATFKRHKIHALCLGEMEQQPRRPVQTHMNTSAVTTYPSGGGIQQTPEGSALVSLDTINQFSGLLVISNTGKGSSLFLFSCLLLN
ncbi:unnamed protein product [Orchesella dallaii]|uniref:Uncharacterized protein n=1 Tax=Orchesella dallaii TaxID=48710 RepID=A0ABP1QLG9_9HEXA